MKKVGQGHKVGIKANQMRQETSSQNKGRKENHRTNERWRQGAKDIHDIRKDLCSFALLPPKKRETCRKSPVGFIQPRKAWDFWAW